MSAKYEVEVLLRPAVEVISLIVCLSACVVLVVAPDIGMMPPSVAYGCAAIIFYWALKDGVSVYRVWKYRYSMVRSTALTLKMGEEPKRKRDLYLGHGFEWEQKHTQRLSDTYKSRYRPFLDKGGLPYELFRYFDKGLPVDMGGSLHLHGVEPNEKPVFLRDKARDNHTLVLGVPGSGKTTLMSMLAAQDIMDPSNPPVIIFDPKGDAGLLRTIISAAHKAGREEELTVFHLGFPELSARYNAIASYSRLSEIATRISSPLPDQGNSATFKEFAWRFTNSVAKAQYRFGEVLDYASVRNAIQDIEPLFIRIIEDDISKSPLGKTLAEELETAIASTNHDNMPRVFASRSVKGYACYQLALKHKKHFSDVALDLSACFKYEQSYYDKLVASLGPLLEKLTSGKMAELLAPAYFDENDERDIFSWQQVIARRGIAYIGLDAVTEYVTSSAVGNSMLADLVAFAGDLYKETISSGMPMQEENRRTYLHLDEINDMVGSEFVTLINKCRGAGLYTTAYTQNYHDIEVRLGTPAKAKQTVGNFGNRILLHVGNKETSALITDELPMVEVKSMMAVSGVTDSNTFADGTHFTSSNQDRFSDKDVPMLDPSSLTRLPIGHGFGLMDGGVLHKFRVPIYQLDESLELPEKVRGLLEKMDADTSSKMQLEAEGEWWGSAEYG